MVKYLSLLGLPVRDRVTGFVGIVTTISFDLYGCIQAIVSPGLHEGKLADAAWFDTKRLEVTGDRVMDQPTFEVIPGGATKSLPPSNPIR